MIAFPLAPPNNSNNKQHITKHHNQNYRHNGQRRPFYVLTLAGALRAQVQTLRAPKRVKVGN